MNEPAPRRLPDVQTELSRAALDSAPYAMFVCNDDGMLERALQAHALAPVYLEIEITETVLLGDSSTAVGCLRSLHELASPMPCAGSMSNRPSPGRIGVLGRYRAGLHEPSARPS